MDTLNHNLKLTKKDYPYLFKLRKKELEPLLDDIFKTGYNCIFNEQTKVNTENNQIAYKISSLENTLEKLIGLSVNSSKKGELGENLVEEILKKKYSDINYTNMSTVKHSGDAWIKFNDINDNIMLEIKNYVTKVDKDEIIKMKNDMKTNNINWGIFISWNSSVNNYKEFDIDTFNHQGQVYTIIILTNLSNDIDRIDMGIQLIRKLILNYSNSEKFPWVTNKIKSDLDKLNEIIQINYQLRDWYDEMEKSIKLSLNKYYSKLRDYQLEIDTLVKNITLNINGTMEESLCINNYDYHSFLENYKDNKKIFPILTKIIDKFKEKNIFIDNFILLKNEKTIGLIKVQCKKIFININKYSMTLEFSGDDNHETLNLLTSVL